LGSRFVASLPPALRTRLACQQFEKLLRRFALFTDVGTDMIRSLSALMQLEVYLPSDFIIVATTTRPCMFFLARGRVQIISASVRSPSGYRFEVVTPAQRGYFNDLSLFVTGSKPLRLTTIRALTHADTFSLSREGFEAALGKSYSAAMHMASMAKAFYRKEIANLVVKRIRNVLQLRPRPWSPPEGLADKLRRYAVVYHKSQTHESLRSSSADGLPLEKAAEATAATAAASAGDDFLGVGSSPAMLERLNTLETSVNAIHEKLDQLLESGGRGSDIHSNAPPLVPTEVANPCSSSVHITVPGRMLSSASASGRTRNIVHRVSL